MIYRRLGHSGLEVSALCFGTWDARDGRSDHQQARCEALLESAYQKGVTFVDVADVYQSGGAERAVGRWFRRVGRNRIVVGTKVGGRTWEGCNGAGAGRKHLREACEASLRRLETDYIDLYQLHSPDPETPVEETVHAMDLLVSSGKILYWGLSNCPPDWASDLAQYAVGAGRMAPISVQNGFNLLRRHELESYEALGPLALVAYSPLAQGLLTDRQVANQPAPGSRVARNPALTRTLRRNLPRLRRLQILAASLGLTLSQLALAWLLSQQRVTSVVIGASNPRQLAEDLAAADMQLSAEVIRQTEEAARSRRD